MKKILTAIVSVSIFIVGILLILCADTNFLWYAFNQNVRLTVVAGILIALVGYCNFFTFFHINYENHCIIFTLGLAISSF